MFDNPSKPTSLPWLALFAILTAGCQQAELDANRTTLDDLDARLDGMNSELSLSRSELEALRVADDTDREMVDARLAALSRQLDDLPRSLEAICTQASAPVVECEEPDPVQRVVISNDKMLVGELEHVWIDPPGVSVVARVDTGATSSSLHAENIVHFERDGEDWVRFDMMLSERTSVSLERPIIRHARVIQQADPAGSRRPVVAMRVRLGDVQDTFEFSLADRSHLENEMILGRNFLADVTLVDVGRQFIQPRQMPQ
jgi:hypothetical protein